jgi:hypothetical protein
MNTYIKTQLDKVEVEPSQYPKSIKIYDGNGNSTNQINITELDYKLIRAVLLSKMTEGG